METLSAQIRLRRPETGASGPGGCALQWSVLKSALQVSGSRLRSRIRIRASAADIAAPVKSHAGKTAVHVVFISQIAAIGVRPPIRPVPGLNDMEQAVRWRREAALARKSAAR